MSWRSVSIKQSLCMMWSSRRNVSFDKTKIRYKRHDIFLHSFTTHLEIIVIACFSFLSQTLDTLALKKSIIKLWKYSWGIWFATSLTVGPLLCRAESWCTCVELSFASCTLLLRSLPLLLHLLPFFLCCSSILWTFALNAVLKTLFTSSPVQSFHTLSPHSGL